MESDMFNMSCGQYHWTVDRSKECFRLIKGFLNEIFKSPNSPDVCLTGIFGRLLSINEYIYLAALHNDYDVYIKTLTTQYGNIHNVPEVAIEAYKNHFVPHCELMKILKKDPLIKDNIFDTDMPPLNWHFDEELDKQKKEDSNYQGEG
jgi:hypothetical protein